MPVRYNGIYNLLISHIDDLLFKDLCNGHIICSNMYWDQFSYYLDMYCFSLITSEDAWVLDIQRHNLFETFSIFLP
jgi:hypothetical protein